jgi:hypothetical protein
LPHTGLSSYLENKVIVESSFVMISKTLAFLVISSPRHVALFSLFLSRDIEFGAADRL